MHMIDKLDAQAWVWAHAIRTLIRIKVIKKPLTPRENLA